MKNIHPPIGAKRKKPHAKRMPGSERRIQLLNAAREIVRREGVGALTMNALAEAVGVSKPVAYSHFKNKEEIIINILKGHAEKSALIALERVKSANSIFEYIEKIIDGMFDHFKEDGVIIINITHGLSSNEEVSAYFSKIYSRTHDAYRQLLLQQGVPEKQADVAAYALMQMISMTVLELAQKCDPADRETLKKMVRGAIRCLVPGEGVKPTFPTSILDQMKED